MLDLPYANAPHFIKNKKMLWTYAISCYPVFTTHYEILKKDRYPKGKISHLFFCAEFIWIHFGKLQESNLQWRQIALLFPTYDCRWSSKWKEFVKDTLTIWRKGEKKSIFKILSSCTYSGLATTRCIEQNCLINGQRIWKIGQGVKV